MALRTAGPLGWRRVLRDLVCTEQLADTRGPERPEWRCVTVIRAPATNGVAVETVAWGVRPVRAGGCRGTPAQLLSMDARVLAAADIYQALVSDRPHRPAHPPAQAARTLVAEPGPGPPSGRGGPGGRRPPPDQAGRLPGLTGREVEVLRLLVRGRSERQIAAELFIAASTVHTHITHLYDKAGVSTRASAAVFAMEHGLIHPAPATCPATTDAASRSCRYWPAHGLKLLLLRPEGVLQGPCRFMWWAEVVGRSQDGGG